MTDNKFDWVDKQEKQQNEDRNKSYFNIIEGSQQFVLLSHCAPLAQVYDKSANKYRPAEDGDTNVSIKGVCWVLQDGLVKQAKLPYVVVKMIRGLQDDQDWEFTIPFPYPFTLKAKGAGTKEVDYSLTPSPKKTEIPQSVLDELAKKPTPEEIVEKIKSGKVTNQRSEEYPTPESEGIAPENTPF